MKEQTAQPDLRLRGFSMQILFSCAWGVVACFAGMKRKDRAAVQHGLLGNRT